MDAIPAEELVGLLAESDRLRTCAALVLGASTVSEVAAATGLDVRRVGRSLSRLVDGGLVAHEGGGYRLLEDELRASARAAAAQRATPDEHGDALPEVGRVLRAFLRDGCLVSIPVMRSKRLVILDVLAQQFQPGVHYSEAEVNRILADWHPDVASLRRHLVDEAFLDRDRGHYWRVGGTVDAG